LFLPRRIYGNNFLRVTGWQQDVCQGTTAVPNGPKHNRKSPKRIKNGNNNGSNIIHLKPLIKGLIVMFLLAPYIGNGSLLLLT